MAECIRCGKTLERDEIGLHKKLINRGAKEFMCLHCISKEFDCDEELLLKKIQDFKSTGCTLFV